MILATDMAKHASDLAQLKTVIANNNIVNGKNVDALVCMEDENTKFENQQFIMEICLHSADVSIPAREFSVVKEWTYLLFEEFFTQGDLEKENNLPVSMLCDRCTTHVAKS
jgi:cAMP-specific phosphodiesterase 4